MSKRNSGSQPIPPIPETPPLPDQFSSGDPQVKASIAKAWGDAYYKEWNSTQNLSYSAPRAELEKLLFGGYVEIVKGGVDRSIKRVEYVGTASAAIGTIYAAIVALRFDAATGAENIPLHAAVPAGFLALSILFVGVAMAGGKPSTDSWVASYGSLDGDSSEQLKNFANFANAISNQGRRALDLALLALSAGIATLPMPFLDLGGSGSDEQVDPGTPGWVWAGAAVAVVLALRVLGERLRESLVGPHPPASYL